MTTSTTTPAPASADVQAKPAFRILPLSSLLESPLNNRRHYNEQKLEELTASVRQKGVLTPLLARPKGEKFEIAAGHRRFRAATKAGVLEVPVMIREMTDAEFLEVLTIENLQREDIHEMDEAIGYAELIEKHGYTVETIGAKVSKSTSYVYQRLKLAALIPPAQKLFFEGVITAGHAILIARLSVEEQREVLNDETGILWPYDGKDPDHPFPVSVRGLADAIRDELYLDLSKAPFKKDDAVLVPAAGACSVCPKRSGSEAGGLYADIKEKNICTDRGCYNSKLAAFIGRQTDGGKIVTVSADYGRDKRGDGALRPSTYHQIYNQADHCKFAQPAIMVDGNQRGQKVEICKNKDCTKHHRRSQSSSGSETAAAKAKRLDKEKQEKVARDIEIQYRRRVFEGIAADLHKSPKIQPAHLALVAVALRGLDFSDYGYSSHEMPDVAKSFGLKASGHKVEAAFDEILKLKPARMAELVVQLGLLPLLEVPPYRPAEPSKLLESIAKLHSIDVKSIAKQVREEIEKAALQTSAKPGKKGKAA